MPEFVSNGVKLYYEEAGEGTPIILLHGLSASLIMFKKEMAYLKKQFRVIAIDFRGHGKSEKPTHYTLEDHIRDVISLMDHLRIKNTSLIGASMGSYIAQGVAIAVPKQVDKLILIVPKSYGKTSSTMRLFAQYANEIKNLNEEEKLAHMSKYIFHNLPAVANSLEGMSEMIVLTPEQHEAANKALVGFDFRSNLHKITAKTLVISGRYDGLNPPEYGRETALHIKESTFAEFENSGHAPNVEEPERFKEMIIDFLV